MGCTEWPLPGMWARRMSPPRRTPILLIGNTGDPATPYEGAKAMADALGKGVGIELTYKGEGHGAYNSGNKCVQQAVNSYLLEGKAPAAGHGVSVGPPRMSKLSSKRRGGLMTTGYGRGRWPLRRLLAAGAIAAL